MADETIGTWTPAELERYIKNNVLTDPAAVPKQKPFGLPGIGALGQLLGVLPGGTSAGWVNGIQQLNHIQLASAGNILYDNIPQNFRHLLAVASLTSTFAAATSTAIIRENGVSTNNYNYVYLLGNNNAAASGTAHGGNFWHGGDIPGATIPSSRSATYYLFPNYALSGSFHSMIGAAYTEGAAVAVDRLQVFGGNFWADTNPISSLLILDINAGGGATMAAGASVTFYGLG